jgi:hypothetical protein
MDHSKFSDCKLVSTILFRNCCNTKITKPSHVENALYLDYLKSNPTNAFVKKYTGDTSAHHVFYHLHQTRVHKVFYLYLFKRYKTPFVIVSGSSDLTTPRSI